mmetsp:Transcript_23377/g.35905  ORF Transcript_23377/g.35905 Transcript_23377/m.35905 type:complete len:276 (-) Transcript_23377:1032-1859(-)
MEVASPFPMPAATKGTKRSFSYSPMLDAAGSGLESTDMMDNMESDTFMHTAKRRRFHQNESISFIPNFQGVPTVSTPMKSPFQSPAGEFSVVCRVHGRHFCVTGFGIRVHARFSVKFKSRNELPFHLLVFFFPVPSAKRARHGLTTASLVSAQTENSSQQRISELERVVQQQNGEVSQLKEERNDIEKSFASLKSVHEKTLNENKILKRAVTIQQERYNQAASEVECARQYKNNAEEKIRKLEQVIMTLRYHLQAQGAFMGNDFMGRPPHPPNVF